MSPIEDIRHFTFTAKPRDPGPYGVVKIDTVNDRTIEVSVSPTGRNVHVYVDGKRWVPA